ncbi:MAG: hypothetical protein Q4A37_01385 [Candidatus Saccharibacteria bacterium]|nr:hypothetical protein [Candidatus Saccharibacteria bacterium]
MKEKPTSGYYAESIVDFTTAEGQQLQDEIERTGELPEQLRRELGGAALEASYVLVRLPGDAEPVHYWMRITQDDIGTRVRNTLMEGEDQTPEQRLGLPPAEETAQRVLTAAEVAGGETGITENGSIDGVDKLAHGVEDRKVASELLAVMGGLRIHDIDGFLKENQHAGARVGQVGEQVGRLSNELRQSTNMPPRAIMRQPVVQELAANLDSLRVYANGINIQANMDFFRRNIADTQSMIEEFRRGVQRESLSDDMCSLLDQANEVVSNLRTSVQQIDKIAHNIGIMQDGDGLAVTVKRLLNEASDGNYAGDYYAGYLTKLGNGMIHEGDHYRRALGGAIVQTEEIIGIMRQLNGGAKGEAKKKESTGVSIERQEVFPEDVIRRAMPLKKKATEALNSHFSSGERREMVSAESIASANDHIAQMVESPNDFSAYMEVYYDEQFGDEPIDQLRLNADLRAALLQYFEQSVENYPRPDELPDRVRRNDPGNLKAINYLGYSIDKATSHQYVAMLMLSMLDGSFDKKYEDMVQTHVLPDGKPGYGQHRGAARMVMDELMRIRQ